MSPSAGRPSASVRLRRLLAMVPWVAAADGPAVEDVCARFDISEEELVEDLSLLFMCGLHPYTPDMLIEADVADGRVWIRYADYFSRPLRLTASEALALVAAGAALLALPGTDADGPLARGLAKLAAVLGVQPDEAVDVELGAVPVGVLEDLRTASRDRRRVAIDYYAYGKDERRTRVVDPWSVFSAAGQWYVLGWCHTALDERLFRVDRIRGVELRDETFSPPRAARPDAVYSPRPNDPSVVLELSPSAAWVAAQYPHERVDDLGDGRLRVQLRVSERPWLERLLLRLGPDARVVEGGEGVAADAAKRILTRYDKTPTVR